MSTGAWNDNTGDFNFDALIATSDLNYSPGRIVSNQTIFSTHCTEPEAIAVYNSAGLAHFALDTYGFSTSTSNDR